MAPQPDGVRSMTDDNQNIVSIDGKTFNYEDDFDDRQRYLVSQIKDLQEARSRSQFYLDQLIGSLEFFTNQLMTSLESDNSDNQKETG